MSGFSEHTSISGPETRHIHCTSVHMYTVASAPTVTDFGFECGDSEYFLGQCIRSGNIGLGKMS